MSCPKNLACYWELARGERDTKYPKAVEDEIAACLAIGANVLAYAAGMLNSFVLNRAWTFRAEGGVAMHAWRFTLLNATTLAVSTLVVLVLVDRMGLPELAVWLPLTIAILVTHYLGMKHWAFAERT